MTLIHLGGRAGECDVYHDNNPAGDHCCLGDYHWSRDPHVNLHVGGVRRGGCCCPRLGALRSGDSQDVPCTSDRKTSNCVRTIGKRGCVLLVNRGLHGDDGSFYGSLVICDKAVDAEREALG